MASKYLCMSINAAVSVSCWYGIIHVTHSIFMAVSK